ncbi:4'-phosphopantetheinyl transferase family protein [Streptacidiphilus anmyonensis]|uniref:4'-phosphopantetheinyl transferase family protein n=1 Tax=Streptacidiphilus anmyonensis TaxID=405782 RepID=UPI0006943C94|nr:4'-phosphopantetheinyl transferase superfamily protein [Streptacidiphilus anmyonensis]
MAAHRTAVWLPPTLSADAELWLVSPSGQPTEEEYAVLDAAERRRAASFRRPARAALYVAAHVAMRRLLGEHLGIPPEEVVIGHEPGGRPVLADRLDALHFSLSHSEGVALLGVADRVIGVDVQGVPSPATAGLCAARLHAAERAEIEAHPDAERPEAFARVWARKEAYLKGLGTGLQRALEADYLGDGPPGSPSRPEGWTVLDLACGERYAAAMAIADPALPATPTAGPLRFLHRGSPSPPPNEGETGE